MGLDFDGLMLYRTCLVLVLRSIAGANARISWVLLSSSLVFIVTVIIIHNCCHSQLSYSKSLSLNFIIIRFHYLTESFSFKVSNTILSATIRNEEHTSIYHDVRDIVKPSINAGLCDSFV